MYLYEVPIFYIKLYDFSSVLIIIILEFIFYYDKKVKFLIIENNYNTISDIKIFVLFPL